MSNQINVEYYFSIVFSLSRGIHADIYLAIGSIFSFTSAFSLSGKCETVLIKEKMYGERVWETFTKSMSDIILFRWTSSSYQNITTHSEPIFIFRREHDSDLNPTTNTVKVCSTFLISESKRVSSMNGSLAIP